MIVVCSVNIVKTQWPVCCGLCVFCCVGLWLLLFLGQSEGVYNGVICFAVHVFVVWV